MKAVDNLNFVIIGSFLLICYINCQVTQCDVQEYMSVVHNLEALRVLIKDLQTAVEDLKLREITNVEDLQGRINNTNSEIARLKANTSAIESNIATLNDKVDSEIETLVNKNSEMEFNLTNIEATFNTEVEALKSADTGMQTSINDIKNINIIALQTRDTIIQGRLDQVETDVGELQSVTNEHQTNITLLSEKCTQLESSVDSNRQDITALNSTVTVLTNAVDTLEAGKEILCFIDIK